MQIDKQKISYVDLPQPSKMLTIELLDYPNPYDFKALHRHDYFEIILINQGEGSQLIDFTSYPVRKGDVFVVYPGQVHLMKRNTANGLIIQFKKELFEYIHPVRHYHLYADPVYRYDEAGFAHIYDMADRIKVQVQQDRPLNAISQHKAYSYLQLILILLTEANPAKVLPDKDHYLFAEFLSLVTAHIHTKKKVAEYCQLLNCQPGKLNAACRKSIGKTALELIHEELLLEIRRLLLLGELSFKEIAYHLNFDSPSNFNGLVKTKTGLTPKELQQSVIEMYK